MELKPRRIALFTGNYNHIADGVSLTLNRLVAYLEQQGIEVLVFGPTVENPPVDHNGTLYPVPSISAPGRPEYRVSLFLPLQARQKLLDFKPDLIHIATPDVLGLQALVIAGRRNIPVVASFHTNFASYLKYYDFGFLERFLWSYLRWFYRRCEALFVPTTSMQEELISHGISTDFRIWARGVEITKFHPDKRSEKWREQYGIGPQDKAVLFVSRLVWEKNLRAVIEVFKGCENQSSTIKTVIVGDGPALKSMKKALPQSIFTGKLSGSQLQQAYASCDLFFFPSDTETFGNVTLEAMASGLPVVAANAAGNRSLVNHGINGLLAGANDHAVMRDHIISIISDAQKFDKMAREARRIAESYDWESVFKKLMQNYREIQNKSI